ncbi:hypothetical protein [Chamaesiphon sp.]|uniref:hypothetical protein n=1 Tax=Chamaesiphon sp. TaxID=2814140 RepID=UPI0035946AB6
MKYVKRILAIGAIAAISIPQPAQAIGLTGLLPFIPGLDPGIISAINTANTYLPMLTNLANGQLPSLQTIAAIVAPGGVTVGGYNVGLAGGTLSCNTVGANGEIDLSNTTCNDVAQAISKVSNGQLPFDTAQIITMATKIATQNKNISDTNNAIATARNAVLTATGNTISESSTTISNIGSATVAAQSSFARIQQTNQALLQTGALLGQGLGLQANQLTTSAQGNRIASAQLSIEQAKAEKASSDAQIKARMDNGFVQNSQNAKELRESTGLY